MSVDFGFEPVKRGKRYFISYKSSDADRIGEIARELNKLGVPMWYDHGLEYGLKWKSEISKEINKSEAFIIFVTKGVFSDYESFIVDEYEIASNSKKTIFPVWLDEINSDPVYGDVREEMSYLYVGLNNRHLLEMVGQQSPEKIAAEMVSRLQLIHGREPQPPTKHDLRQSAQNPCSFSALMKSAVSFIWDSVSAHAPFLKKLLAVGVFAIAAVVLISFAKSFSEGALSPVITESEITPYSEIGPSTEASTDTETEAQPDETFAPIELNDGIRKGDRNVLFGNYPQGENEEVEPLAWRVLDVKEGKALLLTEKLIDRVAYNDHEKNVTWEKCTLREWLNSEFIGRAFNDDERARILETTNYNFDNPKYGTEGGEATVDRVFILSIDEANKYFVKKEDRMAIPTPYALTRGGYESTALEIKGTRTGWWFLRSPGGSRSAAAAIETDGAIYLIGSNVDNFSAIVRPAIWVELK